MKPSLLEKSSMDSELLQARIGNNENVEIHVEEETSKEDPCNFMSEKHIERNQYIEIKEKDIVEENERLDEESYFLDYIPSLFEELENDEFVQEEENDLEKNERTKEKSEEKRENSKEELDNFGEPSKNQEGRLDDNSIKTLSFFPSNYYLCFKIYFKEIKLFSLVFIEHGDHFTFLNALGTYLERRYFIEFNSISCAIPRVDEYDFNIANCVTYVLGVDNRRSMEKELGPILEDLSISLSLNPSSLCIARTKPSYHDLKLLHDNFLFDRLNAKVSTSYASMWREFVENCDYESSFIYASKKNFDGFIPSTKLLCLEHKKELWENLEASKPNREEDLNPTASSRVMAKEKERLPTAHDRFTLLSPVGFWPNTCLKSLTYHPR
ncbi:hypothetical protein M9H77_03603 [Catharanthus roseus]|uniref:Uncharacterized protein n=1 Tax=Catharanthus roseus TaxID=4058 RepID=A0ACC0CBW6_CATRO|nr:hypothetical protein M9H77_03603 [Catharanthus roseus]